MEILFIRHATLVLDVGDAAILIDPMLGAAGSMDPVANSASQTRIPTVDLPFDDETLGRLIEDIDGVVVTHTHRDHWDKRAIGLIPKDIEILCQPEDAEVIRGVGFDRVLPVEQEMTWRGIQIIRTGGRHGTGEIGMRMGPVSGFIFKQDESPTVYLAGDTVWCEDVERALMAYRPDVTILNTGGAQFLSGDPITMTPDDVVRVSRTLPGTKIIAVHMETVNHCLVSRDALAEQLRMAGVHDRVHMPADGERIVLNRT